MRAEKERDRWSVCEGASPKEICTASGMDCQHNTALEIVDDLVGPFPWTTALRPSVANDE
jgi:hypothetical protein